MAFMRRKINDIVLPRLKSFVRRVQHVQNVTGIDAKQLTYADSLDKID